MSRDVAPAVPSDHGRVGARGGGDVDELQVDAQDRALLDPLQGVGERDCGVRGAGGEGPVERVDGFAGTGVEVAEGLVDGGGGEVAHGTSAVSVTSSRSSQPNRT